MVEQSEYGLKKSRRKYIWENTKLFVEFEGERHFIGDLAELQHTEMILRFGYQQKVADKIAGEKDPQKAILGMKEMARRLSDNNEHFNHQPHPDIYLFRSIALNNRISVKEARERFEDLEPEKQKDIRLRLEQSRKALSQIVEL